MNTSYQFKTEPFNHQLIALARCYDAEYYGLLMEQRTGKSKVIIDDAAIKHSEGKINALFIVAPNGVHRNWITDEIPTHLPDHIPRYMAAWSANHTKKKLAELEALFNPGHHLRILTMNIEALANKKGRLFARRFLNATDCMMVVDESTRIKGTTAAVTKVSWELSIHAKYRRILNGTPITQSPMDIYAQLLFLHEEAVPVQSYVAFRNRYAEVQGGEDWLFRSIVEKSLKKAGRGDLIAKLKAGDIDYEHVSMRRFVPRNITKRDENGKPIYKNLDELQQWIDKCCYRVLRKDCADIPEKIYKRWDVEIPDVQQKIITHYLEAIRKGHTPEPVNKMNAVMHYQRMLCGYIPQALTGSDEALTPIFPSLVDNPRIQAILEIIDAYPDDSIIFWSRFKKDLYDICQAIEEHTGKPPARYWGDISNDEREQAKQDFQAKRVQYFVGQQGAGGVGLPLHAADVMVYHSNTFSLYHRLQSEDRAENLAKTQGTLIIDLEARGTADTKIIQSLRDKKDVADLITGDPSDSWLAFTQ